MANSSDSARSGARKASSPAGAPASAPVKDTATSSDSTSTAEAIYSWESHLAHARQAAQHVRQLEADARKRSEELRRQQDAHEEDAAALEIAQRLAELTLQEKGKQLAADTQSNDALLQRSGYILGRNSTPEPSSPKEDVTPVTAADDSPSQDTSSDQTPADGDLADELPHKEDAPSEAATNKPKVVPLSVGVHLKKVARWLVASSTNTADQPSRLA